MIYSGLVNGKFYICSIRNSGDVYNDKIEIAICLAFLKIMKISENEYIGKK